MIRVFTFYLFLYFRIVTFFLMMFQISILQTKELQFSTDLVFTFIIINLEVMGERMENLLSNQKGKRIYGIYKQD